MKESPSSNYPNLIFREVFRSEQETRKNGGTPTDVDFANGKGTFNGTSSKVNYNLGLNGTYSVRVRCNPTSFAENNFIFDFRGSNSDGAGSLYLSSTTGTIQASGTKYRNGIVDSTTVLGANNEIIVTGITLTQGTGANLSLIGSNYINTNEFLGTMDLVEIYSGTLTASEVSNLYNDRWNTELPPTTPREVTQFSCDLNVSGWQRCADNNATDSGGTYGAGKSLKAVGSGNGTDDIGFSGLLSGYRNTNGSFYALGSYLRLWSSTPSGSSNAWRRAINASYSTVRRDVINRGHGFSVRCLRDTDDTSDFTDPRDGTVYQCVRIGTQVWMTKNLAYLPSVNAAADNSTDDPMYYVYGYDGTDVATAKALSNYTEYGVLYNHPAAIISAPTGFHVPSDEELNVLEVFVVKMIKLLNPNNTLIDFDSTNGVLELGDLNETFTATDVDIVKTGSNYGALFNGTTSQISVGTDPVLTKAITGMHIFKPLDLSSDMCYYSNGKYQFIVLANGGIEVQRDGSTSALSATGIIKSNGTYGIAYTSEADGTTNIYFTDLSTGLVISGSADQSAGTPANGTTDLILGANVGARYNGYIMKDKIIEGVLSLAEMTRFFTSNSRGIR